MLELSSSDFDAADTAEMDVVINGRASGWKWTFAGPGHPLTVAQGNRLSRERLHRERQIEQARANNRKWKAEDEDVDEVRKRNIDWVVERLVGWPTIKLDGELLEFSQDAARKLLSDPRKVDLFVQAMDFLAADNSFTKRSVTI
jgi:hypothetical protein